MPKDAAYFGWLVPSRRVQRDTSKGIIITLPTKIKSSLAARGFARRNRGFFACQRLATLKTLGSQRKLGKGSKSSHAKKEGRKTSPQGANEQEAGCRRRQAGIQTRAGPGRRGGASGSHLPPCAL
jgi:hypothetical protein